MAVGMRQLEKSSANLSQKIDCLEAAPGKRWELIVKILSCQEPPRNNEQKNQSLESTS